MKKLVALNGGLSSPSTTRMLTERIAAAVQAQVSKRGEGIEVEFIDISERIMDLATVMSSGLYNENLRCALDSVSEADALIAASPVFSASYSGLFKMFFDALDKDALTGMPVIIAATAGTERHSLILEYSMRPLMTYLRANPMPTAVFAATDDFGQDSPLDSRVIRAARELAEYVVDVRNSVVGFGPDFAADDPEGSTPKRRSTNTKVDSNVTSFSKLLKGHDGIGN